MICSAPACASPRPLSMVSHQLDILEDNTQKIEVTEDSTEIIEVIEITEEDTTKKIDNKITTEDTTHLEVDGVTKETAEDTAERIEALADAVKDVDQTVDNAKKGTTNSDDDDDAYDPESGVVEIKMNLEDVLANSTLKDEDRTQGNAGTKLVMLKYRIQLFSPKLSARLSSQYLFKIAL